MDLTKIRLIRHDSVFPPDKITCWIDTRIFLSYRTLYLKYKLFGDVYKVSEHQEYDIELLNNGNELELIPVFHLEKISN